MRSDINNFIQLPIYGERTFNHTLNALSSEIKEVYEKEIGIIIRKLLSFTIIYYSVVNKICQEL